MGKTHISLLLRIFFLASPSTGQISSSDDNSYNPFSDDLDTTDVDECRISSTCPRNSLCRNTLGSYYCECKKGYNSTAGNNTFISGEAQCNDIDECKQCPSVCGPNADCKNKPGSFLCRCHDGYTFPFGTGWIIGKINCTAVRPSEEKTCVFPFKYEGQFYNTCIAQGRDDRRAWCATTSNYDCDLQWIFCPKTGKNEENNDQMRDCTNSSHQDLFCSLLNEIKEPFSKDNATVSLKDAVESFGQVLNKTAQWHNLSREDISIIATSFLEKAESIALAAISTAAGNGSQTVITKEMELQIKVLEVNESCEAGSDPLTLTAKGNQMKIHCSTIIGNKTQGSAGAAFASYTGIEEFLTGNFFNAQSNESEHNFQDVQINSRIVTGVTASMRSDFTHPVNFTLQHIQEKHCNGKAICVFWNHSRGAGSWSPEGCETLHSNVTYTECSCDHLSSFAVLMAIEETEEAPALWIITCVGITFSLVCLCLAILTFLLCHPIRNANTSNHLQLSLCLFMGQFIFLVGIHRTYDKIVCAVIAGFLHYFFLAAFSWMFLEALMLFLTVRNLKVLNYFSTRNIKTLHLCLFGYGLPALIVIISVTVNPSGYGTEKRCWLSAEKNMIWSFLGPVCLFILINSILFATTLCILRAKLSTVNADVSTLKNTRLLTFKAIAQLFILGCTWIFGFFQIGAIAVVMSYLFTIINSLQGAFIFLIHCVLNRQVREEYRRCFKTIQKQDSETQPSGLSMSTTKMMDTSTDMKERKLSQGISVQL